MSKLKVLLCAYHWIGCRALEQLLSREDISDIALFTHRSPDGVLDVSKIAMKHNLFCSTEDVSQTELPFEPDIIASIYYRNIIRRPVIEGCDGRIFNLHPSLLPRYRGCSSVPWAIIEGDTITGVTFHYIDEGVDTGRIILQATVNISSTETQSSLYKKCMEAGMRFFQAAFELVKVGFPGIGQKGPSTFHRRGCPYNGEIQADWPIEKIERFIRAMTFPPYPYANYKGHEIKSLDEYLLLSGRSRDNLNIVTSL